MEELIEDYYIPMLLPVTENPKDYELSGEEFNPEVHLQLEPPLVVKDLNFNNISYPYDEKESVVHGNLAYTTSFRVLSDEGVAAARRAINMNQQLAKSNPRATKYLRGLGYCSKFHRGLAYNEELLSLLSSIARDKVGPQSMTMNISHTNIGEVGTGKPVDKWHTDSVDYVMVIILSDLTDMVGGELAVLQMPDASGVTFQKLVTEGIPQELVEITKYAGPGYCIFMQGSKILHTVNAVLSAREPRLSLVNSYMSLNPFKKDYTKFNTFGPKGFADRDDIRTVEYARHKAWRAQGQLQYLMDNVKFGAKNEDIISFLRLAAAELVIAAERIGGLDDDNAYWVEENKDNANTTTPLSKI